MKILLIMPKIFPKEEIDYNYTFPLGICYISAVIKKAGYNVKCLNLNHYEGIEKTLREELKNNYDIVATGSIWMGFIVIKAIVAITRMYSPKSKIIIGGTLISSKPELVMYELKPDFGVIGEGEETIIELIRCIEKKENVEGVKGICFINDNTLFITETREGVKDIDSLSYPDLDGFEFEKYLDEMYTNQMYQNNILDYPRTYSILTARGCTFHCTFCYHQESSCRERSINVVIKELKWAKEKYKINIVNILDDTFGMKEERIMEFCNKIKPLNLNWTCQMIVSSIDNELLLLKMKECGCYLISYGFESYSKDILKSMKKSITPEQIDYAIRTTMKVGIGIQGNFIFGDIKETKETAQITLDYWKRKCKGQVKLGFIQPYAGSNIYGWSIAKGVIKDEVRYMSKEIWNENFFNITESMTNQEINELMTEIITLRNSGYFANVFPTQIYKLPKEDRYKVEVKCPYCNSDNSYDNYYFKMDTWYKDYMMCRECGMRYNICKPI